MVLVVMVSPLAEGRELKYYDLMIKSMGNTPSPLAEGRELKYYDIQIMKSGLVAPRGGA